LYSRIMITYNVYIIIITIITNAVLVVNYTLIGYNTGRE